MKKYLSKLLSISLLVSFGFSSAQKSTNSALLESYSSYFESPREYVHVHLNKTTLIEGESLGFTAYVFNAYKKPSLRATNLYCTITDSSNSIVKEKLILVQKGVSSNIFEIDSTLGPGEYKFNAYTNWMRNFEERLYFSKSITIINSSSSKQLNPTNEAVELDVQILPEGGHLLQNLENVLGIVIKNQFGKGTSIRSAYIVNHLKDTLTKVQLDRFGIGRALLRPLPDESYALQFSDGAKDYDYPIAPIEKTGIMLSTRPYFDKVLVKVSTNTYTMPAVKNKEFVLALHNANSIKTWTFNFNKGTRLELEVEGSSLKPGMNIFTVFDHAGQAILERLYFNYNGLNHLETANPISQAYGDTLKVMLKIPKADPVALNNLSVSVLPKGSISYNQESNILSNLLLRPYVKGYIQNAAYYFTDISNKTKRDLDNLLITQGWSSYKWTAIFGPPPAIRYPYEQGIYLKASINQKQGEKDYMLQPLTLTKSFIFDVGIGENTFEAGPLFPLSGEQVRISEISNSGRLAKPRIVPRFSPSSVPPLDQAFFRTENQSKIAELRSYNELSFDNKVQQLDVIELTGTVEQTRYERLKKISRGMLDIFDDNKRVAYTDFATYISSKGYIVREQLARTAGSSILQILSPVRNNVRELEPPLIILDGIILNDFSILYAFDMDTVDYIEIDKSGASMGMRGANGVIRIVTNPGLKLSQKSFKEVQNIEIPLKFSKAETYYTPKYQFYDTSFYEKFGVVDWFPNLTLDRRGAINLQFNTQKNKDFLFFIEGFVNEGDFVSEIKTIRID